MSTFFAVAVGNVTGTFPTKHAATEAVGTHPLPLTASFPTEAAAEDFIKPFSGAAAVVYTDGACLGNGKAARARAGVGVFWGEGDARNVSREVHGAATNNVAELEAVGDAVDTIAADPTLRHRPVVIVTDSKYVIGALVSWFRGWESRDWKTSSGEPVKNLALIQAIHAKVTPNIRFVHVRGHQDHLGNIKADELAGACLKPVTEEAAAAAPSRQKKRRKVC